MTAPEWRDCADPDELAAAAAAGVEVQVYHLMLGWQRSHNINPAEFRDSLQRTTYRLPTSWTCHGCLGGCEATQ